MQSSLLNAHAKASITRERVRAFVRYNRVSAQEAFFQNTRAGVLQFVQDMSFPSVLARAEAEGPVTDEDRRNLVYCPLTPEEAVILNAAGGSPEIFVPFTTKHLLQVAHTMRGDVLPWCVDATYKVCAVCLRCLGTAHGHAFY